MAIFGFRRGDSMSKRYSKNTKKSAPKWKRSSKESATEYAETMAKMFGTPKSTARKNYKKGVGRVSAKKFARSIDKQAVRKWRKKLQEAVC